MEDQLAQLLANTMLSEQAPRQQAEIELKRARTSPSFPAALANIASHASVAVTVRQAALTNLRLFVEANWANEDPADEPQIPIADDAREHVKQVLLDLAIGHEDDRKVKTQASYTVGKIAIHDFPEKWPSLLPSVLGVMASGTDNQLRGALKVLGDLTEESISEDQFFSMARDIAGALTEVVHNANRKPMLRALAISVFRTCLDLMNMVKDSHVQEVEAFARLLLDGDGGANPGWISFFIRVLQEKLPPADLSERQPEEWNSIIALKLQVVKTLIRLRRGFATLLLPHSTDLFTTVWAELTNLQGPYAELYVNGSCQGRLEDADSLPYTVDFLVLEELDFLNQCFRAPHVKAELDAQLQTHAAAGQEAPWVEQIMTMLVCYSRIIQEEEELWDIDCSLYLAEEIAVTANYTPRTAAGDLLIKLGEWFNHKTLDGLFRYTTSLFPGEGPAAWRSQESALYLFVMLLSDFQDLNKPVSYDAAVAYFKMIDYTIINAKEPLLRARGYLAAGMLGRSFQLPSIQPNPSDPAVPLLDHMIRSITAEESEVVQVACVKALEGLISAEQVGLDKQGPLIAAIHGYMNGKDPTEMEEADELMVTLAEALRAVVVMDTKIALSSEHQPLDMLFMLAKLGAANFQVTMLVTEAFEEVVKALAGDGPAFSALCTKTLPTLTGAFDVGPLTDDNPLVTIATELLAVLAEHGPEPLPDGFVAATFPKLNRVLMETSEGEVLRPGAETVKYVLMHDHQQVFNWQDANGVSGLEVCLRIIDRLLKPEIEDNAASEVGGLAAELVEKAGQERLGPYLPQLLQAVATRVDTAQAAAFIQSLILVFARLSLAGARDVVEFLSQLQINGQNGLQIVLAKWLENSISFAGYDEIRQNVIALSKLFSLGDARLAQINVKGDLIINDDGRIKTRSRAKQIFAQPRDRWTSHLVLDLGDGRSGANKGRSTDPDQYTIIPAPLKIIKLLIEELLSAAGARNAADAAAAAVSANAELESDDEDDGWEDDDALDLSLGMTKSELMSFTEGGGRRYKDDETQAYLIDFFMRCGQENTAGFQEWYNMLTDEEKGKLGEVTSSAQ
ncbi:AP-3 adaptor complex subunit beta [Purpureocillium lavendulum]|uniref:AP-3 adaptor complex subunit beta n=1 Tax=Purpureocillium lavendulum TaxID=1247861 RepID=A0AB34G6I5_9HYPO|nr:AP-3 adaptor complex subunit beta [Purpureocillium lavendulum]